MSCHRTSCHAAASALTEAKIGQHYYRATYLIVVEASAVNHHQHMRGASCGDIDSAVLEGEQPGARRFQEGIKSGAISLIHALPAAKGQALVGLELHDNSQGAWVPGQPPERIEQHEPSAGTGCAGGECQACSGSADIRRCCCLNLRPQRGPAGPDEEFFSQL